MAKKWLKRWIITALLLIVFGILGWLTPNILFRFIFIGLSALIMFFTGAYWVAYYQEEEKDQIEGSSKND